MVKLHGDVVGYESALNLVENKFNFILNRDSNSSPEIYVKRVKDGQLARAKLIFNLNGKPQVIKSGEHRKLEKVFDELVERAKALYS